MMHSTKCIIKIIINNNKPTRLLTSVVKLGQTKHSNILLCVFCVPMHVTRSWIHMTHKQNSQLFFPMSHTSSNYVGLINKEFINKFPLLLHKMITTFNAKSIYTPYIQWNLRTRDTLVSVLLSLVERLSLSRRFCFFYCDSAYISFI